MKKLITLIFILMVSVAYSQTTATALVGGPITYNSGYTPTANVRFDATITNIQGIQYENGEFERVDGDVHFVFDFVGSTMNFVSDDANGNLQYDEQIIDKQWVGQTLCVWSETAYYEIKHAYVNARTMRPIIIMEYPYVGEVSYRQYYKGLTTLKPVPANK